jgi:hypothetical protein
MKSEEQLAQEQMGEDDNNSPDMDPNGQQMDDNEHGNNEDMEPEEEDAVLDY